MVCPDCGTEMVYYGKGDYFCPGCNNSYWVDPRSVDDVYRKVR